MKEIIGIALAALLNGLVFGSALMLFIFVVPAVIKKKDVNQIPDKAIPICYWVGVLLSIPYMIYVFNQ